MVIPQLDSMPQAMFADFKHVFEKRLKRKASALPPEWQLWQYKSLNMHRGVIYLDARDVRFNLSDLEQRVRQTVAKEFSPSWWRGFGFGVVVAIEDFDESIFDAARLIDLRDNSAGCWQWLVLAFPSWPTAVGIQTWTEGYLGPAYNDLMARLQQAGFQCERYRQDMDQLMKSLLKIHRCLRLASGIDAIIPS